MSFYRGLCVALASVASLLLIGCGDKRVFPIPVVVEDRAPSWSPDGQWIAYVHFNPNVRDATEPNGIYLISSVGSAKRLVARGFPRSVDWAPDSRWLVFNDDLGLHVVRADGDSLRTIYTGGSYPNWSPDGSEIAFSTTSQVWAIRPDGTGLHEMTPSSFPSGDADWSPDGKKMVLLGNKGSVGEEVFIVQLSDTTTTQLTHDNHQERSPAWSPKGDLIAWSPIMARSELWVMDTLGLNRRRLALQGFEPAWDPSGQTIVFMNSSSSGNRLFVINADGTGLRQLTQ